MIIDSVRESWPATTPRSRGRYGSLATLLSLCFLPERTVSHAEIALTAGMSDLVKGLRCRLASQTSRYIHTVQTSLIMAADSIAGYIHGLMDGVAFTRKVYALDRDSGKGALTNFLAQASSTSNLEWVR